MPVMDTEALAKWLDACVGASAKHEQYFEGRKELIGKAYHAGQREAFLMVLNQISKGTFE